MDPFTFFKSKKVKEERITTHRNVIIPPGRVTSTSRTSTPRTSAIVSNSVNRGQDNDRPDLILEDTERDQNLTKGERRKHTRINCDLILDEEIKIYCRDPKTEKGSKGIVLDISPGGLAMVTKKKYVFGDELLIKCRIGTHFRMKEEIKVKMVKGSKCGAEFINPSEKTTTFLTQLYGAIALGRPRTRNKYR